MANKEIEQSLIREKRYHMIAHNYPVIITVTMLVVVLALSEYAIWEHISWTARMVTLWMSSSIVVAFSFLCSRIIRRIGKDILEDKIIFSTKLKPSTRVLIKSNQRLKKDVKLRVLQKLKQEDRWPLDVKIKDMGTKAYLETIDAANSYIRDCTRHDQILFDRNCNYGFARNIFGGLFVIAIVVLSIDIILFSIGNAYWVEFLYLLGGIIVLMALDAFMTYKEGIDYAERLYDVFVGEK